jgi:HK97 gp10 family phage protein
MAGPVIKYDVTGIDSLDRNIQKLVAEHGNKGINKAMREASKKIAKHMVLPRVKIDVAVKSGFIKRQFKARALKRSKSRVGYTVGFKDDLFTGDTYYYGFLEFGTKSRWSGKRYTGQIKGDAVLRTALYDSKGAARQRFLDDIAGWIKDANQLGKGK